MCWHNKFGTINFTNEQLFLKKVFCTACLQIQFGFIFFCQKTICAKVKCKMLVKSATGVNFANILQAALFSKDPKLQKNQSSHKCLFCTFVIFVSKSFSYNVSEIDTCCQFHQRFTAPKNYQAKCN